MISIQRGVERNKTEIQQSTKTPTFFPGYCPHTILGNNQDKNTFSSLKRITAVSALSAVFVVFVGRFVPPSRQSLSSEALLEQIAHAVLDDVHQELETLYGTAVRTQERTILNGCCCCYCCARECRSGRTEVKKKRRNKKENLPKSNSWYLVQKMYQVVNNCCLVRPCFDTTRENGAGAGGVNPCVFHHHD